MAVDADASKPSTYAAMTLLAVQFALQPLLTRRAGDAMKFSMMLSCDAIKLALALFTVRSSSSLPVSWSPVTSVKVAGLPALVYTVQNWMTLSAYQRLPSLTFNLLNQTKIMSTAAFAFVLLGQRQSPLQCVALVMLMVAAALLSLYKEGGSATSQQSEEEMHIGILAALTASGLSGLASGLSQRAMRPPDVSAMMFTAHLSMCTVGCATAGILLNPSDLSAVMERGLFHSWGTFTVLAVTSNALGGLLVSVVTKETGGVGKGYAVVSGIVLTALLDSASAWRWPSLTVGVALVLVVLSSSLHSWETVKLQATQHPPGAATRVTKKDT